MPFVTVRRTLDRIQTHGRDTHVRRDVSQRTARVIEVVRVGKHQELVRGEPGVDVLTQHSRVPRLDNLAEHVLHASFLLLGLVPLVHFAFSRVLVHVAFVHVRRRVLQQAARFARLRERGDGLFEPVGVRSKVMRVQVLLQQRRLFTAPSLVQRLEERERAL